MSEPPRDFVEKDALNMEDYRSYHATPNQIDSLWLVIGSLRQQIEELTERLQAVEHGGEDEPVTAEVAARSEA